MSNNALSVGQKIRHFRQRAGLSQLELESELGAASGSISRIENDQTNPTKETLDQLSNVLKLNPTEKTYLFGVATHAPTEAEVAAAVEYFAYWLEAEDKLAYLLDQKSRILALSKGFYGLAAAHGVQLEPLVGKSVSEVLFDPSLGIRPIIKKDRFEEIAISVLAVLHQERRYMIPEPWWEELMQRLQKLPDFNQLWAIVTSPETKIDLQDISMRRMYLDLGTQVLPLEFKYIAMRSDNRFNLMLYEPING